MCFAHQGSEVYDPHCNLIRNTGLQLSPFPTNPPPPPNPPKNLLIHVYYSKRLAYFMPAFVYKWRFVEELFTYIKPKRTSQCLSINKSKKRVWLQVTLCGTRGGNGGTGTGFSSSTSYFWGAIVQLFLQWKSNKYGILCARACSFWYPTWNACAPCCHLWPVRLHSILPHYLTNGTT